MKENIKKLIQLESEAIQNIPVNDSFEQAVNMIKHQVHNLALNKHSYLVKTLSFLY